MTPKGFERFCLLFLRGCLGTELARGRFFLERDQPDTRGQNEAHNQEQCLEKNRFFVHRLPLSLKILTTKH
jgi:hypothetical protein